MIKEMYNRFKAEIEYQKGIKVGKLELVDNDGAVTVKIVPKLNVIDISFIDAGDTPPDTGEDIVTTPGDDGTVIVTWGDVEVLGSMSIQSEADLYRIYRSTDGDKFKNIAETTSKQYVDGPLAPGTYYYYVVPVVNGVEGIPSKVGICTIQ